MRLRTRELLEEGKSLPKDHFSVNCAKREFENERDAAVFLNDLKKGLVDIKKWNQHGGLSSYELFDQNGVPVERPISRGLFIRIKLTASGKPDWVKVEDIFESPDEIVITVKPTYDPTVDPPQTGKISHFFSADATNNFCAFREVNKVSLYVIGLNETLNSGHTSGLIETARNTMVANLGYYLGVQKAEWTKFCESFLSDGTEQAAG
jgi:hypothetical protein